MVACMTLEAAAEGTTMVRLALARLLPVPASAQIHQAAAVRWSVA